MVQKSLIKNITCAQEKVHKLQKPIKTGGFSSIFSFPNCIKTSKLGTRKQIQEIEERTALDRKLLAKQCRIRIKIKLSTNIFKWSLFFNLPTSQGYVQTFNKIKF